MEVSMVGPWVHLVRRGMKKVQAGFEPLLSGFEYVSFDSLSAVKKALENEMAMVRKQDKGSVNLIMLVAQCVEFTIFF